MESLKSCINEKKRILNDFYVPVTKEVIDHITELYPSEVAIENYMRDLILDVLNSDKKYK